MPRLSNIEPLNYLTAMDINIYLIIMIWEEDNILIVKIFRDYINSSRDYP